MAVFHFEEHISLTAFLWDRCFKLCHCLNIDWIFLIVLWDASQHSCSPLTSPL